MSNPFPRINGITTPAKAVSTACHRCGGSGHYLRGTCFRCGGATTDPTEKLWGFPRAWTDEECQTWNQAREARNAKAREASAKARVEKRNEILRDNYAAHEGLAEIHEAYLAADETDARFHGAIISDIFAKAYAFPLSDAQVSLVRKIMDQNEKRAAAKDEEDASKIPVPDYGGRVEVVGEVLKAEWRETQFGSARKALLKVSTDEGHFLLWGTLQADIVGADRGDRVIFTARVQRSDDDPSFGFWSRPTKARIEDARR